MALSAAQAEVLAHARLVTKHEGWFPEHTYNGRMKKTLDTLVTKGFLEHRTVNREGIERDCWPTNWYRIPRPTGKDVELPRSWSGFPRPA